MLIAKKVHTTACTVLGSQILIKHSGENLQWVSKTDMSVWLIVVHKQSVSHIRTVRWMI